MDGHAANGGHADNPPTQVHFRITAREFQFSLSMPDYQTILDVKTWIQRYVIGVDVANQTLVHGDEELEDGRTIQSYGFNVGEMVPVTLTVAPYEIEEENFPIMLYSYNFFVSETTTVAELKTMVTQNLGIPEGTFDLYRLGTRMQDHRTLSDYLVGYGAHIEYRLIE